MSTVETSVIVESKAIVGAQTLGKIPKASSGRRNTEELGTRSNIFNSGDGGTAVESTITGSVYCITLSWFLFFALFHRDSGRERQHSGA